MPAITCIKPTTVPFTPRPLAAPASPTKFLLNVDVLYSALAFVCRTLSACACKCFFDVATFFFFPFPSHFIYFWFFGFYMLHCGYVACLSVYLFASFWLCICMCLCVCIVVSLLFDFLFQHCSTLAAVALVVPLITTSPQFTALLHSADC